MLLSDFAFLTRPGVAHVDLVTGNTPVAVSNFSGSVCGVNGYLSFPRSSEIGPDLGNQYTIFALMDPNMADLAPWKCILSVPSYASGVHTSPYQDLFIAARPYLASMAHGFSTSPTTQMLRYSGTGSGGFINVDTDNFNLYTVVRNGDNTLYYRNGVYHSGHNGAGLTPPQFNAASTVTIGNRSHTDPAEGLPGVYTLVGIYKGVMTTDQMIEIMADPLNFEETPSSSPGDPINNASMIYLGTTEVDKIMCGTTQIWLL